VYREASNGAVIHQLVDRILFLREEIACGETCGKPVYNLCISMLVRFLQNKQDIL
jgi:hypothetical protein